MPRKTEMTAEGKYHLLLEIFHSAKETMDLDAILNQLLDTIQTVLEYDAAGIFVLNQDISNPYMHMYQQLIAGIAWRGFDSQPVANDPMLTEGKGIIGHVIKTGESVVVPDVHLDSRYVVGRAKTLSEIAVPIVSGGQTIGALNLESDKLNTYDQADLDILHFFAAASAISIEKAILHQQLLEKKQIEEQLKLANQVQARLLPSEAPIIQGYELAGVCLPSFEIGGDYYDYLPSGATKLGLVIADVSGKGIAAALIMSAFRAILRTSMRQTEDPSFIAQTLNQILPEFTRTKDFVTTVYGVLELCSGNFSYVRCGHNLPLLVRTDGRVEELAAQGSLLGIFPASVYDCKSVTLNPGDLLVMYTDGVIECLNAKFEQFGEDNLRQVVCDNRREAPHDIITKIINATKSFSGCDTYEDDFTLVILKRCGM